MTLYRLCPEGSFASSFMGRSEEQETRRVTKKDEKSEEA
jgi:hypothetical protein